MRPVVFGIALDPETRCSHYHTPLDIIAIRMKCCGQYYACKECHDALADHGSQAWPQVEWDQPAVLCGVCGTEMSVQEYLDSANQCPTCKAPFNPGCRHHYHHYFEMTLSS